jgi:hypothetical protein
MITIYFAKQKRFTKHPSGTKLPFITIQYYDFNNILLTRYSQELAIVNSALRS